MLTADRFLPVPVNFLSIARLTVSCLEKTSNRGIFQSIPDWTRCCEQSQSELGMCAAPLTWSQQPQGGMPQPPSLQWQPWAAPASVLEGSTLGMPCQRPCPAPHTTPVPPSLTRTEPKWPAGHAALPQARICPGSQTCQGKLLCLGLRHNLTLEFLSPGSRGNMWYKLAEPTKEAGSSFIRLSWVSGQRNGGNLTSPQHFRGLLATPELFSSQELQA